MSNFFIDAHCHLDLFQDIQNTSKAEDILPIKTITVTNRPDFFKPNSSLFLNSKNIRVALGLHPELVARYHEKAGLISQMIDETRYIGEIGLDGSKSFESSFDIQKIVFKNILGIIKSKQDKILTIHSRNAAKLTIDLLNEYLQDTSNKIILHWFSGSQKDLNRAIDIGCYFSINHRMTYSESGRKLIAQMPIDRILTETDAPFTFDEKVTNRLQSLETCIAAVAQIKSIEATVLKAKVYENFRLLLS